MSLETKELLKKLCSINIVSGDELSMSNEISEILEGDITITPLGSVISHVVKNDGKTIMLTAHLDQIGMIVTHVSENGFVKIAPIGGVDRRSMAGSRVKILTENGDILGVVGSIPPHLRSSGADKQLTIQEMFVDTGLTTENTKNKIKVGDRVVFTTTFRELIGDSVSCATMDNRAGCVAVIKAAELLKNNSKYNVVVTLTAMEEVGGAGALTATFDIKPEYAFVVDVSMGLTPDDKPEKCGEIGKGPMVCIAPILNKKMFKGIVNYAQTNDIPVQIETSGGGTGTDSDNIAVSVGGVKTALISIPLQFMHTPVEVVRICDIDNTAKLIAGYVKECL